MVSMQEKKNIYPYLSLNKNNLALLNVCSCILVKGRKKACMVLLLQSRMQKSPHIYFKHLHSRQTGNADMHTDHTTHAQRHTLQQQERFHSCPPTPPHTHPPHTPHPTSKKTVSVNAKYVYLMHIFHSHGIITFIHSQEKCNIHRHMRTCVHISNRSGCVFFSVERVGM